MATTTWPPGSGRSTPGHAPGHQSLLVEGRDGPVVLAGQAVYGLDEWPGTPGREGRSTASDVTAYDEPLARLRDVEPPHVLLPTTVEPGRADTTSGAASRPGRVHSHLPC